MITEYNRTSLRFGIPGALLQFPGPFLAEYIWPQIDLLPRFAAGLGSILLLIGLSYYARAKGRHPGWCLTERSRRKPPAHQRGTSRRDNDLQRPAIADSIRPGRHFQRERL